MKESIEKRITAIKAAETPEDLRACVCPFFEKGGCPDCVPCRKTEADLDECRDYYLERIAMIPLDLWTDEFDKFIVKGRERLSVDEIVGIGINCDNCYMYDKCPIYKKGYACGIDWGTNKPETPAAFMDFLISTQYERVKRSAVFEKIDGGVPDVGLSGEIDRLHNLVASKSDMGRDRLSINVEATSAVPASGGGILAKLFGGAPALPEKPLEISAGAVDEQEAEVKEPVKIPRKRRE